MSAPRSAGLPLVFALLVAACQAASPSPSPTPGERLTVSQAKYAVLAELGVLWYCDPDYFPIAVRDEQEAALEQWAAIRADAEPYAAILEHLGWDASRDFSDGDKLIVYREWKVLRAITFEPLDGEHWGFDLLTLRQADAQTGFRTRGTVSVRGAVEIGQQEGSSGPTCPICLSRGTLIETPTGAIAVEMLREGDQVWTVDAAGRRVPGIIERIGSTTAPAQHRVVNLQLDDGRGALVSPGHPTADGRQVGDLRPGDILDGAMVVSVELEPYGGGMTFDLLPSGATRAYWANGILLGSTLAR